MNNYNDSNNIEEIKLIDTRCFTKNTYLKEEKRSSPTNEAFNDYTTEKLYIFTVS